MSYRDSYRRRSPSPYRRRRSPSPYYRRRSRSPPRYRDDRRDRYDDRRDRYDDRRRDAPRRERVERTKFALVCKNLSSGVTWADLKDEARRHGQVTYADANRLRTGEGVVSFKTRDDLLKAHDEMQQIL